MKTPLHLAVNNKNIEMVKLLLSLGADPTVKDSILKTPLDYLQLKKDTTSKSIVRLINRRKDSEKRITTFDYENA